CSPWAASFRSLSRCTGQVSSRPSVVTRTSPVSTGIDGTALITPAPGSTIPGVPIVAENTWSGVSPARSSSAVVSAASSASTCWSWASPPSGTRVSATMLPRRSATARCRTWGSIRAPTTCPASARNRTDWAGRPLRPPVRSGGRVWTSPMLSSSSRTRATAWRERPVAAARPLTLARSTSRRWASTAVVFTSRMNREVTATGMSGMRAPPAARRQRPVTGHVSYTLYGSQWSLAGRWVCCVLDSSLRGLDLGGGQPGQRQQEQHYVGGAGEQERRTQRPLPAEERFTGGDEHPAEQGAQRDGAPAEEPVHGVHPTEQPVRDDALAQRHGDHVPQHDRHPGEHTGQPHHHRRGGQPDHGERHRFHPDRGEQAGPRGEPRGDPVRDQRTDHGAHCGTGDHRTELPALEETEDLLGEQHHQHERDRGEHVH